MTNGSHSQLDSWQAGVETVQECLKQDYILVARMKKQQQFHTHCCAMDFDFMFVMNECNNEIADACVHEFFIYGCYLYTGRTFYC